MLQLKRLPNGNWVQTSVLETWWEAMREAVENRSMALPPMPEGFNTETLLSSIVVMPTGSTLVIDDVDFGLANDGQRIEPEISVQAL